jgi:hypothetical protein
MNCLIEHFLNPSLINGPGLFIQCAMENFRINFKDIKRTFFNKLLINPYKANLINLVISREIAKLNRNFFSQGFLGKFIDSSI